MLDNKLILLSAFILGGLVSYFIYSDSYTHMARESGTDITSEPRKFSIFGSNKKTRISEGKTGAEDIELTSKEPPKLQSLPANKIQPYFSGDLLDSEWELGGINEKIRVNFPDIEGILDLNPPQPLQRNPAVWYKFALELGKVSTGKRYRNSGITSPLLVWYVYIAKHSPGTVYKLYNSNLMDARMFGHLIQFGFLDNWWKNIDRVEYLILNNRNALLSIIFREGEAVAQQMYVSAFFEKKAQKNNYKINVENFLFGLGSMTAAQKDKALTLFIDKIYRIDPRSVETLADTDQWVLSGQDVLGLIKLNAYKGSRRSMSSFFTAAAKLGDGESFSLLVKDAPHNDSQPTNFYCAACALALVSDGLLGAPLINHINRRDDITYLYDKDLREYVIEGPGQGN